MSTAECYVLDVKCDEVCAAHDQFTGPTAADARASARRRGWLIHRADRRTGSRFALCPKHSSTGASTPTTETGT